MLTAGDRLHPRFVLRSVLGRGGMGEVWLADDLERGRPAALKFLHARSGTAAQREALLAHEADCLSRIAHPAVPRPIGCFHAAESEPFLALEAVLNEQAGQPRSLAALRGAPALDWIAPAIAVADALTAAHTAGVVHRDVKPSNVLIDGAGRTSIVDFGVAAAIRDAAPERALRSGGTASSMSPQQRAGEAPVPADDVYAFGALLHELALGRPPVLPQAVASAGGGEGDAEPGGEVSPVPELAITGLPPALQDLILRCLAADPSERPAGMQVVRDELAHIAATELDLTQPPAGFGGPHDEVERIAPVAPHNAALAAFSPGARRAARGFPWRVLAAASAVWMVVLAGVLFTRLPVATAPLPALATTVEPAPEAASGAAQGRARQQPLTAPFEYARLSRERAAMLDDVNRVLDIKERLEAQAVERWGGEQWTAALELAETGDAHFRENDFAAAATAYADAEAALLVLEERAGAVAVQAVSDGLASLDAGDAGTATARFELALAIDPSLDEATRGIERARNLDEVNALLGEARRAEREGDLGTAIAQYEAVLALDPARDAAREALAELRSARASSRFDRLMSDGFAALSAGDFDAARDAFEAAGKLRPGADVVSDALAQVEVEARGERIAALRRQAEAHERDEQWQQALEAYQAALAIDPALVFATTGIRRAESMAALHERLQYYAADPMRLTDTSVRQRASQVLAEAEEVSDPGPKLLERRERLAGVLEDIARPVTVRLESDNQTSVRILRAADLGRFQSREVTLRPGRYTIVGTREGYRDVREEITVLAGGPSPVVVVRCSERI